MINWQEWVVGVLVVLCIARIISVSYTHLTLPTT